MVSLVLTEMTKPYSFVESLLYDRIIAPAAAQLVMQLPLQLEAENARGGSALDVGCGGGQIMLDFAQRFPGLRFQGVDLSAAQVKRATTRTKSFGTRVSACEGSALQIPFRKDSFDIVYSIASIKHWTDQAKGIQECLRVLKPGGRLLIAEVDRACKLSDVEKFVTRWKIPAPLRVGAVAMFRTWVAGNSLDVPEARALAAASGLQGWQVETVAGTPAWLLQGNKLA